MRAFARAGLLTLLSAACTRAPAAKDAGPVDFCQPTGELTLLAEPQAYQGQPVTVHAAGRFKSCDGGEVSGVDVQAQVTGPSNAPVTATVDLSSAPYDDGDGSLAAMFGSTFDGGTLVRADVTFESGELGLYQLTLRFSPNLGVLQSQVISMVDRRTTGHTIATPQCHWFELWSGAELCTVYDTTFTQQLTVTVGGALIAQLPAYAVRPAGPNLWTVDPDDGAVCLWQRASDGGLEQLARQALPTGFLDGGEGYAAPVLVAAGGKLLLSQGARLLLARLDGGALEISDAGLLPMSLSPDSSAILLPGQAVAVGGTLAMGTATTPSFCLVDLADGGMSCDQRLVLGGDRGVLWLLHGTDLTLTAVTLAGGPRLNTTSAELVQTIDFTSDAGGQSLGMQGGFPFMGEGGTPYAISRTGVVRVPELLDGSVVLDGFGVLPNAPPTRPFDGTPPTSFAGAGESCVWVYLVDGGTLTYYPRP